MINEHYQETNRILDIQDAAEAVEEHLLEEARKFTSLKKLSASQSQEESEEPITEQRQSPVTLSNAHTAQASQPAESKLSDEQSKARMAELLKWSE